jgi:hypothetical protein
VSLVIPGVSITVLREVVPRPLAAAGVLGIVGNTERDRSGETLLASGSLQDFRANWGGASVYSMPEVKAAFAAGLNRVVVANLPAGTATKSTNVETVSVAGSPASLTVTSRAPGRWSRAIRYRFTSKTVAVAADKTVDVEVFLGDQKAETYRNLSTKAGDPNYFVDVINQRSSLITISVTAGAGAAVVPANVDAEATPAGLAGGTDATVDDYLTALARLESYADVDMVAISHRYTDEPSASLLHAGILSHCQRMAARAKPRIGFGEVMAADSAAISTAETMAAKVTSDRFVLVAPRGYMGAVIGMIAGQRYFESPTFKALPGVADLSFDFSDPELEALIQAGVCAVDMVPRRGIAVVKGITTDAGQINVTRVADRAVRHVQNIAQDFIGLLNTEAQRLALKQRITEAFARMEKDGALVPDGKSPAFTVAVTSAPDDFQAGIVRVEIAVRPVRAIDYIYSTIMVQAF